MKDSWILQRIKHWLAVVLAMVCMGVATRLIEDNAWREVRAGVPELRMKELEPSLGQGLIIGLFGGFRTLIADFLFIQAYTHWEKQDRPNTETLLHVVTEIDPRPLFFWINSARIVGYDFPAWRIRELGGFARTPEGLQKEINQEHAELALSIVDRAERFHPDKHEIPLERAQIYSNRLKDTENAAQWYLATTQYEGAPHYAARIYAQLLRQLGQPKQAYEYLRELYPTLPMDDPTAVRPIVLGRIRELEAELGIPLSLCFPVQEEEL